MGSANCEICDGLLHHGPGELRIYDHCSVPCPQQLCDIVLCRRCAPLHRHKFGLIAHSPTSPRRKDPPDPDDVNDPSHPPPFSSPPTAHSQSRSSSSRVDPGHIFHYSTHTSHSTNHQLQGSDSCTSFMQVRAERSRTTSFTEIPQQDQPHSDHLARHYLMCIYQQIAGNQPLFDHATFSVAPQVDEHVPEMAPPHHDTLLIGRDPECTPEGSLQAVSAGQSSTQHTTSSSSGGVRTASDDPTMHCHYYCERCGIDGHLHENHHEPNNPSAWQGSIHRCRTHPRCQMTT